MLLIQEKAISVRATNLTDTTCAFSPPTTVFGDRSRNCSRTSFSLAFCDSVTISGNIEHFLPSNYAQFTNAAIPRDFPAIPVFKWVFF
jgi:hypothetical protein